MKIHKLICVAAVALSTVLATNTLQAQNQGDRPQRGQGQQGGPRGGAPEDQIKRLSEQLGLTADQQAKLKPIMEANRKKMTELRDNQNLSREERREKFTALREEFNTELKKILTKEQLEKFEKMRQERQRQGGGPGGGQRPERPQ